MQDKAVQGYSLNTEPVSWLSSSPNCAVIGQEPTFSKQISSTASPANCLLLNFTSSLGSINGGHLKLTQSSLGTSRNFYFFFITSTNMWRVSRCNLAKQGGGWGKCLIMIQQFHKQNRQHVSSLTNRNSAQRHQPSLC